MLDFTPDQADAATDAAGTIRDAANAITLADSPADAAEHLDAIDGAVADLREALSLRDAPIDVPTSDDAEIGVGIVKVRDKRGMLVGVAEREEDGAWRTRVRDQNGFWLAPVAHPDRDLAVLTLGWALHKERG